MRETKNNNIETDITHIHVWRHERGTVGNRGECKARTLSNSDNTRRFCAFPVGI